MTKSSVNHPMPGCTASGAKKADDLIDMLLEARKTAGWSKRTLAVRAEVKERAIQRLEKRIGTFQTLIKVMDALDFRLTNAGVGSTLSEQLRNSRQKRTLSIVQLSAKTKLSRTTIAELEKGRGSIASLLKLMAVLAPNAKRRAEERAYWGADRKGDRDLRFTPADFMDNIYKAFGPIDLDPCGNELSPVIAKRVFLLNNGDDGLNHTWSGRLAFVNPPYSATVEWLKRCHDQWSKGNVQTIVALVPNRTDSRFFHETLIKDAEMFILQGRVKFRDPQGSSQSTPFSLMLLALGATAEQKMQYAKLVEGYWCVAQ